MQTLEKIGQILGIPEQDLIKRSILSFLEKEIRLSEEEISRIRDRYDCSTKEDLYHAIQDKKVVSHPAWEDYILWKNKESHIEEMKKELEALI